MSSCVASERIVGWYHTGPTLKANDLDINRLIAKYCPAPVLVVIDVRHTTAAHFPIESYVATEEIHNVTLSGIF